MVKLVVYISFRTDISAYKVFKNGEFVESVHDLTFHPWSNMVSFYLGCSFSFDDKLIKSGIKKLDKNVSMFITNIQCQPVGDFAAKMVVSMRAIPKTKLQLVYEATINSDYAHGAPIHIGRPADIGITDMKTVDFGTSEEFCDNEVPVFWACGVTSSVAIKASSKYKLLTQLGFF